MHNLDGQNWIMLGVKHSCWRVSTCTQKPSVSLPLQSQHPGHGLLFYLPNTLSSLFSFKSYFLVTQNEKINLTHISLLQGMVI